ncbi:MAG: SBBP repeat-containing protein [Bacteroidetes bacterium]|nr:SBBP repeat-containing protein [Bacteroidota bacterium]
MKKLKLLLLVNILFCLYGNSQPLNFKWVTDVAQKYTSAGLSINRDVFGNIFTVGTYVICKLDSSGRIIWQSGFAKYGINTAVSIVTDNLGNAYVTGDFRENNSNGVYVQKLDSHGNQIWIKKFGGNKNEMGYAIAIDTKANIYVTGQFESDSLDANPGTGVSMLYNSGITDIFIEKLDSGGNFIWAKKIGGYYYDFGRDINIDKDANVYLTGGFTATVDFDPDTSTYNLTAKNSSGAYIEKIDSSGKFIWARVIGANNYDEGYSISTDIKGNVYCSGMYMLYFVFVSKTDPNGNLLWIRIIKNGDNAVIIKTSVLSDNDGNVYTAGDFEGSVDFNPSSDTFFLIPTGNPKYKDMFIQKLDSNGDFLWAESFGGPYGEVCEDMIIDDKNNFYLSGLFGTSCDFDPSKGVHKLTPKQNEDMFVLKLGQSKITSISNTISLNVGNIHLYPNPATSSFTIQHATLQKEELIIYNVLGKVVFTVQWLPAQTEKNISVSSLPKGVYFVRLGAGVSKVVVE